MKFYVCTDVPHTDTQTHRRTDTETHRHTDTQTHTHTDTYAHRHTRTQTQTHTHTHTNARTHARTRARPHTHTQAPLRPPELLSSDEESQEKGSSRRSCHFVVPFISSVAGRLNSFHKFSRDHISQVEQDDDQSLAAQCTTGGGLPYSVWPR